MVSALVFITAFRTTPAVGNQAFRLLPSPTASRKDHLHAQFAHFKTAQRPNGPTAQRSRSLVLSLAALGLATLLPSAARAQTQDLFVTNLGTNTILRYAGTGPGTFSTTATALSDPNGTLDGPTGLAFDARGNLFASNAGTNTITEFAAGTTPGTFEAATTLTGVVGTQVLAFDARGNLFASNGANNTITEFAAGATPGNFGAATRLTGGGLNTPVGLAFDAQGDLFAANTGGTNTITEFAFTPGVGAAPGTFAVTTPLSGGLSQPKGLAFDARGDLFATNVGTNTITEFAFNPTTGALGAAQTVETGLSGPRFVAFGPSAPVPEASTTVSLGLLLALGLGGMVVAGKRRKA